MIPKAFLLSATEQQRWAHTHILIALTQHSLHHDPNILLAKETEMGEADSCDYIQPQTEWVTLSSVVIICTPVSSAHLSFPLRVSGYLGLGVW